MRIISSIVAATGVLATALTFAGARPAEAGRACNELGLRSPCIKSSDLKARINLDQDGKDARLRLRDAAGANAVELNGGSGNVTNLFSNEADESNGLVKAWARINADGSIASCWRCDPSLTRRTAEGIYVVDFTPLATDIAGRPKSATVDDTVFASFLALKDSVSDASSVVVTTRAPDGSLGDSSFVLIIY